MTDAAQWTGRRLRGFEPTGSLLRDRIRTAGESRGFAVSRLLTNWAEVVGPETAAICHPVKIGYAKGGFGATLTLLTTGAQAPLLQMQLPAIRERVNACYGYNAVSRVTITQTAPSGFSEGQAAFAPAAPHAFAAPPTPEVRRKASEVAGGVADGDLRAALEALAQNVLSRTGRMGRSPADPEQKG